MNAPRLQLLPAPRRARPAPHGGRTRGRVRWFNDVKGYGFIAPDDGGADLFVRHGSIDAKGFRALDDGQRVSFSRGHDGRGPEAQDVKAG